jgi:hypothetical protein
MFFEALLNTLLLVLAVNGTPLTSRDPLLKLSMSRQLNNSGISNILKNDQARVSRMLSKTSGGMFSPAEVNEPITNVADSSYIASVGIGSPPTECEDPTLVL